MFQENARIITVSELTHSIKSLLELQYRFVHIQGEISNLRSPLSGHLYFTLKDKHAQIRAVLFKGQQKYLQKRIEEGQQIICHGRISVYEPRGEYQIIVDSVDHTGTGDLQQQFEVLKRKLYEEGLFDSQRKRPIPLFPEHIAVVTSPTGAAIQDFLKVARKRKYYGKITIIPVSVQGNSAAAEIAQGVETANKKTDAEILVLIRGGGSFEDLQPFNEEKTGRIVAGSILPVVSGIGHEIDQTITDLCCDLHTHTPTAAAEQILPDTSRLIETVSVLKNRSYRAIGDKISKHEKEVSHQLRIMGDLDLYLSHFSLKLDHQVASLLVAIQKKISLSTNCLQLNIDKLNTSSPIRKLALHEQHVEHLRKDLTSKCRRILERKDDTWRNRVAVLDSVSPLKVLARGYSVVRSDLGKVITDASSMGKGDSVEITLHKGQLDCEIKAVFTDDQCTHK